MQRLIKTLVPMIEPPLALLQVQVEDVPRHPVEMNQTPLCVAPKQFKTVDMLRAPNKLLL